MVVLLGQRGITSFVKKLKKRGIASFFERQITMEHETVVTHYEKVEINHDASLQKKIVN
jgi:hypothetical protein